MHSATLRVFGINADPITDISGEVLPIFNTIYRFKNSEIYTENSILLEIHKPFITHSKRTP